MDLSKAFDTIDNISLLSKLNFYRIRGSAQKWIQTYLSIGPQVTEINNIVSDTLEIECGVPQGSILGPLLFFTYIHDITSSIVDSKSIMYVEDCTCLIAAENQEQAIAIANKELTRLATWFQANRLALNTKKIKSIIFSRSNGNQQTDSESCLNILGNNIDIVSRVKLLRVELGNKLIWKYHIANISSKLSTAIAILYKIRHTLSQKWLLNICNAHFLPYLSYGIIIWGSEARTHSHRISILQKRALKLTLRVDPRTSSNLVYAETKAFKIRDLYEIQNLIFMYKHQHGLLPQNFHDLFILRNNVTTRDTCSMDRYYNPHTRLSA